MATLLYKRRNVLPPRPGHKFPRFFDYIFGITYSRIILQYVLEFSDIALNLVFYSINSKFVQKQGGNEEK